MIHNLAAPLAQTASGTPWPLTLLTGGICVTLCWSAERYCRPPGKWLSVLNKIPVILLAVKAMDWVSLCWPQDGNGHIPLILLLLAAWTAEKGRAQAAVGALGHLIHLLLGIVLLAGIPELRWENLKPTWGVPDPFLMAVLLVPALRRDGTDWKRIWITAVAFSFFTQGILTAQVAGTLPAPFWELGRSMSLFGTTERFESLIAVGMTLGLYGFLTELLSEGKGLWLLAAILYLQGITPSGDLTAVAALLTWVILPLLEALKLNLKNMKKGVDKC